MLFWFAAALLTLGASLAVLVPLARRDRDQPDAGDYDLEVYKDQLAELERDALRGLIHPSEADEARAEIGRRILKVASSDAQPMGEGRTRFSARLVGVAAILAVPVVSWGLYFHLGSPDLPSQPLQARQKANPERNAMQDMVRQVEARVASVPDDGKGWDVLAPVYIRMGRAQDAVVAFGNAIRLEGPSASREAGLGEAIVATQDGMVTAEARSAFERALKLDPANLLARYFLAMAKAQDGQFDEASAAWRNMLTGLPADSPWRPTIEQVLDEVAKVVAQTDGKPVLPAPSEEEMDAAAGMSDADREAMIETMVSSLDEKLRQNPMDIEGWQRLLHSYMVLGRKDNAAAALERAIAALGKDGPEARGLVEFAAGLGLKQAE